MRRTWRRGLFLAALCALGAPGGTPSAQEAFRSGLQQGQRPGPYTAVVALGPQRGQLHCFICETGELPAVIVFARSLSDPLGKLCHQLDRALTTHKKAGLRAWVTFLSDDQPGTDPKVVRWGQKHAVGNLPLAVFEDPLGPPSYRLARDADVTVLLYVRQKVVANFAYRAGALNDNAVAEVLKALPLIVEKK